MKTLVLVNEKNVVVPVPPSQGAEWKQISLSSQKITDTLSGMSNNAKNLVKRKDCFSYEMSEAETQYSINNTAHRYWSASSHSSETEAEIKQANLIKELKSVPDPSNHVRENSPAYN